MKQDCIRLWFGALLLQLMISNLTLNSLSVFYRASSSGPHDLFQSQVLFSLGYVNLLSFLGFGSLLNQIVLIRQALSRPGCWTFLS